MPVVRAPHPAWRQGEPPSSGARLKGGAKLGTVLLHQICHSTIHAHFSEAELARRLADVEALRAEPALAPFLDWIRSKPADFHAPTAIAGRRRKERADQRRR